MVMIDGSTKVTVGPKLILEPVVWKDLGFLEIMKHNGFDRTQWRQQIQVADTK